MPAGSRVTSAALAAALLLACLASGRPTPRPALAAGQTVKLKLRVEEGEERLFVPFRPAPILVERGVDLRALSGKRLPCRGTSGERIHVDVKGDGSDERLLQRGEILELEVLAPGGGTQRHAIRLVNDVYERPCLEPACVRVGKLQGTTIAIIDADLDGSYDDLGRDLMVVGKLPHAFPLSRTIVVGRRSFALEIEADGSSLQATPVDAPLGSLDFASELHGLPKPRMAVFRRVDGDPADHVAAFRSPALLPAGAWSLAYAVLGDDLWAIGGDDVPAVTVGPEPARCAWGAPFSLRGAARIAGEGTRRTFVPPAKLQAPRLIEERVEGKHVVCEFPPEIVGRSGLRYVGSWQSAGIGGVSLADKAIASFEVLITQGGTVLNTQMPRWAPYDMSGLVKKGPTFWTTFEWPVGETRGALNVAFRCESRLFGGELRSEPVAVRVD